MQHSTSKMVSIFEEIFNPEICKQLAKRNGFIQRSSSRLEGHEFIKALVLPSQESSDYSLSGLCFRMQQINPKAELSAPALLQRINRKASVELMRSCMQRAFQATKQKLIKQYTSLEGSLKGFNNVYIQDSTLFELNKQLAKKYPGTKRGGRKDNLSCVSQIKIDLIYNFATAEIIDAEVCAGKNPDQTLCKKIIKYLNKDDLVLRDLGYFKIDALKKIADVGAYFISRLSPNVKVYLNPCDDKSVDLAEHIDQHYRRRPVIDINVYIGAQKMPVRLLAYKLPRHIIKDRMKKALKKAKAMKRQLSDSKRTLMKFAIFITNVSSEMLRKEEIGTVYRIRWEIELIFKQWKSLLKIDALEGVNCHRIECFIFARLCMLILLASTTAYFMYKANQLFSRELSAVKLIKYLQGSCKLYYAVVMNTLASLEKDILTKMKKRLLKAKRERRTSRQKIINREAYYKGIGYLYVSKNKILTLA